VFRVFPRWVWPGAAQCTNECIYIDDAEPWRNGARTCFIWCVLPPVSLPLELDYILVGRIGIGALISPLIATQFAQTEHWYFHYLFLLGATMVTLSVMVIFFRGKPAEGTFLLPFLYENDQHY